jgi:hypothetical protein
MNDETRERLQALNERIRAAMQAAHINPATGAPYTAEEIDAIKNAGVSGAEAGATFRDFINTLDVSGLKTDPVREMRERLCKLQSGHWIAAAFIGVDFTTAGERAYRIQIEAEEGTKFVAQAEEIARTSTVDFYGAVRFLRQRRAAIEAIQRLGESVSDLAAVFAQIGEAISNGAQAGTQSDTDTMLRNRHDRRASKHRKPI